MRLSTDFYGQAGGSIKMKVYNLKRVVLLCLLLKRSSRVASLHGHRKLSISDNLGVVCTFSKGRSGQDKLNRLCRQACALQFATGIMWSLRHVETKRNVADKPSRLFEKQQESLHRGVRRTRQCEFVDFGVDSGHAVSAPSKPSCSSTKPLRGIAESSSVSFPSVTHVSKQHSVPNGWFPFDRGNVFLELFSVCGSLTRRLKDLACLP